MYFTYYIRTFVSHIILFSSDASAAKEYLVKVLTDYVLETKSARAQQVLDNIDVAISKIWMLVPASEKANPLVLNSAVSTVS